MYYSKAANTSTWTKVALLEQAGGGHAYKALFLLLTLELTTEFSLVFDSRPARDATTSFIIFMTLGAAVSLPLGVLFRSTTFPGLSGGAAAFVALRFLDNVVQGLTQTIAAIFRGDPFHVPAASLRGATIDGPR
jgi:hypothetical protein